MWKKRISQHSIWLISVPLVGALLGYMLYFYIPGRRDLMALREQLRATEATIHEADMLVVKIPAVQSQLGQATAYNETWNDRIAPQGQIVGVFGSISRLASDVGVSPSRFAPEKVTDLRYLRQVAVDLACTGEFEEIREFIHRLEDLPQFVWLNNIELSAVPAKNESDRKLTKCELNLVIFGNQREISD
ncbi:MAG: type 4a pilus biogenesis protein PilO [Pirellulales bacterium]|nr:type 4a pilus biogenesis protein PilO [Pirellulales bacterium]